MFEKSDHHRDIVGDYPTDTERFASGVAFALSLGELIVDLIVDFSEDQGGAEEGYNLFWTWNEEENKLEIVKVNDKDLMEEHGENNCIGDYFDNDDSDIWGLLPQIFLSTLTKEDIDKWANSQHSPKK